MGKSAWDIEISPRSGWMVLPIREVWRYRDLVGLLVRRDFVANYKQTILGPLWIVLQPVITSLTFVIIFSRIANIPTDGVPSILFYLAGITWWSYFADCLVKTSGTFIANANVFGKVYFPRIIMPLSVVISNLVKLSIQTLVFTIIWLYYLFRDGNITPHYQLLWLIPVLILILGVMGMGAGILISSLTTRYRDLAFLVGFGVQLLMYLSPVVYPLSVAGEEASSVLLLNPIASVLEAFKYIFLGKGFFSFAALAYSACFASGILIAGLLVFNKVEKSFMDTV
ncbi:MAG: ABC transporter permease [Bacteroidia bacterium]|nr:ABC transporter permease [Bacteroidia bacterium]